MTGLRERIEAKTRRKTTWPLQVGDDAPAQAQVQVARAALDVHQQQVKARRDEEGGAPTDAEAKRTIVLRGVLKEAKDRLAETVVDVELQALEPDVWEQVMSGSPEDEAGDLDLDEVRGQLLAASCTAPDLQDAAWWDEQLAKPVYSKGDIIALTNLLMALNLNTPTGRQGKD